MARNMLLYGKTIPLVAPPPGKFQSDDLYCRSKWKHSAVIAEEFWKAWKSEYLSIMMTRQKWATLKDNVNVGDIVLVADESARCDWRLGRITNTLPGKDGLVRKVEVTLGNQLIDMKGKPIQAASVLTRPITKVVIVLKT